MKIQQTIFATKERQHLPSEIQVSSDPVTKVPKSPLQNTFYTAEDLIGLSWVLFEEEF